MYEPVAERRKKEEARAAATERLALRVADLQAENKRLRDALLPLYEYVRDNVDLDAVDERTGQAVNATQELVQIECRACSIAGGAGRAVFHDPPACPMSDLA